MEISICPQDKSIANQCIPEMGDPSPQMGLVLSTPTGSLHGNYPSGPTPQHMTFEKKKFEKIRTLNKHLAIPRTFLEHT